MKIEVIQTSAGEKKKGGPPRESLRLEYSVSDSVKVRKVLEIHHCKWKVKQSFIPSTCRCREAYAFTRNKSDACLGP